MHSRILLSHERVEIMASAETWTDLEIITLSEVSLTEKDNYSVISYIWNLIKSDTNELIYKQKQTHRSCNQIYGYQRGHMERMTNQKIGIDIYTLLCIKQITNKDLVYSTRNSTQCLVITYMDKESKNEYIYMYVCVCIYIYIHTHTYSPWGCKELNMTQQLNNNYIYIYIVQSDIYVSDSLCCIPETTNNSIVNQVYSDILKKNYTNRKKWH